MEAKFSRLIQFFLITTLLASCTTAPKSQTTPNDGAGAQHPAEELGPPQPYGPLPSPEASGNQDAYGPEPVQLRPVVLVLGPGLARGFAFAGVFRALSEAKVPIGAIVGTETGALIGTLYAMSETINGFEWSLQKFKREALLGSGGLLTSLLERPSDGKNLSETLREVFGTRDLRDAKVPVHVVVQEAGTKNTILVDGGRASEVLRAALAVPGIMESGKLDGMEAHSAGAARPYAIAESKALGIGPVVAIDVLGKQSRIQVSGTSEESRKIAEYTSRSEKVAREALRDADLVIRPELDGISYMDFQRKTDIAFQGKKAAVGQVPTIRHLVGLPQENAKQ